MKPVKVLVIILTAMMTLTLSSGAFASKVYTDTGIGADAKEVLEIRSEKPLVTGDNLPIVLVQVEQTLIPIGTKILLKLRLRAPGNKIVQVQDILTFHGDTMWSEIKQKSVKVISIKPWQIKFRNPGGKDYITIRKNGRVKIGGRIGGTYWNILK